jgi:hypothetical protein
MGKWNEGKDSRLASPRRIIIFLKWPFSNEQAALHPILTFDFRIVRLAESWKYEFLNAGNAGKH